MVCQTLTIVLRSTDNRVFIVNLAGRMVDYEEQKVMVVMPHNLCEQNDWYLVHLTLGHRSNGGWRVLSAICELLCSVCVLQILDITA